MRRQKLFLIGQFLLNYKNEIIIERAAGQKNLHSILNLWEFCSNLVEDFSEIVGSISRRILSKEPNGESISAFQGITRPDKRCLDKSMVSFNGTILLNSYFFKFPSCPINLKYVYTTIRICTLQFKLRQIHFKKKNGQITPKNYKPSNNVILWVFLRSPYFMLMI